MKKVSAIFRASWAPNSPLLSGMVIFPEYGSVHGMRLLQKNSENWTNMTVAAAFKENNAAYIGAHHPVPQSQHHSNRDRVQQCTRPEFAQYICTLGLEGAAG